MSIIHGKDTLKDFEDFVSSVDSVALDAFAFSLRGFSNLAKVLVESNRYLSDEEVTLVKERLPADLWDAIDIIMASASEVSENSLYYEIDDEDDCDDEITKIPRWGR